MALLLAMGVLVALSPAAAAATETQVSSKTVCVTEALGEGIVVGGLACAQGVLETTRSCSGTGPSYHCDVSAVLTLTVTGPETCGKAWSEATGTWLLNLCAITTPVRQSTSSVPHSYPVPPEGRTVTYTSTVCAKPNTSPPAPTFEWRCKTWQHEVFLPGDPAASVDVNVLINQGLTLAGWASDVAMEAATNPPVSLDP